MKKARLFLLCMAMCLLYAALTLLFAQSLIHSTDSLFALIAPLLGLPERDLAYVLQILSQLRTASVALPWAAALMTGALCGIPCTMLARRKKRLVLLIPAILLFIPLTLAALLFTAVNDIRVISLLITLLPLAGSLL